VRIIPTWHSLPNDPENKDFIDKVLSIPKHYFDYVNDGKHYHNFFIRIMFEKDTFEYAKNFYLKLVDFCPEYIESSLVADPKANSNNTSSQYEYTEEQLTEYYKLSDMINKYKQLYTVVYDDGSKEKLSFNDMFLHQDFTFYMWKCNACKDYLYIHCNGNIYPCQSYYEANIMPIYNMYKTPFYDIEKMKPLICRCKTCSCDFEIRKERIFK
jgi:hypothetical protein